MNVVKMGVLGLTGICLATPVIITAQQAEPTIQVWASLSPAASDGSFGLWVNNATIGARMGVWPWGDSLQPSFYTVINTTISPTLNVETPDFHSWQGVAPPTQIFKGGQNGNELHFVADIKAPAGTKISLSDVRYTSKQTVPGNPSITGPPVAVFASYSPTFIGVNNGSFITSGSSSQMVDEIIAVGFGMPWYVYGSDPGATDQDKIDNIGALYDLPTVPFQVTGTYSVGDASGSATVNFTGIARRGPGRNVPDHVSTAACLAGLCLILFRAKVRMNR